MTEDTTSQQPKATSSTLPMKRKRTRVFTADDRASHRIIEKQRREALNEKFLELARLLPGLAQTRRLSKSIIINQAIAHQNAQRSQRISAVREIRRLRSHREELLREIYDLREILGRPAATAPYEEVPNKDLSDLFRVEEEVFGTFPAGFGDNSGDLPAAMDHNDDNDHGEEDTSVNGELDDRSSKRRTPSPNGSGNSPGMTFQLLPPRSPVAESPTVMQDNLTSPLSADFQHSVPDSGQHAQQDIFPMLGPEFSPLSKTPFDLTPGTASASSTAFPAPFQYGSLPHAYNHANLTYNYNCSPTPAAVDTSAWLQFQSISKNGSIQQYHPQLGKLTPTASMLAADIMFGRIPSVGVRSGSGFEFGVH